MSRGNIKGYFLRPGQKVSKNLPTLSEKTSNPRKGELCGTMADSEKILKAISGLEAKVDGVAREVKGLSDKMVSVEDGLNAIVQDVDTLKQKMTITEKEYKSLEKKMEAMVEEKDLMADEFRQQFNELERRSRAYSIRIFGIETVQTKHPGESSNELVADILIAEKIAPTGITKAELLAEIELSHPLGRNEKHLIARFHSRSFRNQLLQQARKVLRASQAAKNIDRATEPENVGDTEDDNQQRRPRIRVVEDMTKMDYLKRKKALPRMDTAYKAGKKVRFANGQLWIDGKVVDI